LTAYLAAVSPAKNASKKPTAAKLRSWRVSFIRKRGQYLGTVEAPNEKAAEATAVAEFDLGDGQRKRLVVQRVVLARTKGCARFLLTGVAALLMAISAHTTENPDMCAVVLKTPDGFLALRTKPEPKSKMMSKLFPGQVLRVDIDKYRSKNWIYVEGLVENSERWYMDGWVYSKYIQSFVCPSS
jgi:hypothetical protein